MRFPLCPAIHFPQDYRNLIFPAATYVNWSSREKAQKTQQKWGNLNDHANTPVLFRYWILPAKRAVDHP
jgi:hypothetical protein